jgi:hypothetical protein
VIPADSLAWARLVGLAGLAVLLAGCPRNIPQDKATSKDGKPKGARAIKLDDDGEGRSKKDIVTYPGGDRVDWKVFEVPPGKFGTLKIKLQFTPPRPGLDVAFNVYDQYYQRIGRAKPTPGTSRRIKRVNLENVEGGKYYLQIYAPRRGDAGEYRVSVRFAEATRPVTVAVNTEIPDPPTLPAIPEATEPTPTTTPVVTPTEPVAATVAPVAARIVKYQVSSSGSLIVTVDKGKNAGVENGWRGQVLSAAGRPLEGGDFTVTKVTSAESVGKVGLSVDQVKTNRKVVLSAQ